MCSCTDRFVVSCGCEPCDSKHLRVTDYTIPDVYLTTSDLDTLVSEMQLLFAKRNDWFDSKRFGLEYCDMLSNRLLLYTILLNTWTQHGDGTTTGLNNYISRNQFSIIINDIRNILGYTQVN